MNGAIKYLSSPHRVSPESYWCPSLMADERITIQERRAQ
jgi:hypothetical protein